MSITEAKKMYDTLLERGELKVIYSSMKGNWEADKSYFLNQYEKNQKALKDLETGFDLDDDIDEFNDEF